MKRSFRDTNNMLQTTAQDNSLVQIDSLLRQYADECSQDIDFNSIKMRAVASARFNQETLRKKPKNNLRFTSQHLRYVAAALMLCFGIAIVVDKADDVQKYFSDKHAYVTPASTTDELRNPHTTAEVASTPDWLDTVVDSNLNASTGSFTNCVFVGTLDVDPVVLSEDDSFFDTEASMLLPEYMGMNLTKEDNRAYARGSDNSGNTKYYEFSIVYEAPYKLPLGEMGEISDDEDGNYVFFWHVSAGVYFRVKMYGFDEDTTQVFILDLCSEIIASG